MSDLSPHERECTERRWERAVSDLDELQNGKVQPAGVDIAARERELWEDILAAELDLGWTT